MLNSAKKIEDVDFISVSVETELTQPSDKGNNNRSYGGLMGVIAPRTKLLHQHSDQNKGIWYIH